MLDSNKDNQKLDAMKRIIGVSDIGSLIYTMSTTFLNIQTLNLG